jgi:hypothetical protein
MSGMLNDRNVALVALRKANPVTETDATTHQTMPDCDRAQLSAILGGSDGVRKYTQSDPDGQRCASSIERSRRRGR